MIDSTSLTIEIAQNGFAIRESILSPTEVAELLTALDQIDEASSERNRSKVFAIRNLLDASPAILELAHSAVVCALVEPILGPKFFPVRGILFDKISDANWKVPWHQDVTIAVQEKVVAEGFGPWSVKAGVLHVQPPASVLEHMLSVRLHLDTCSEANGALRVLPGTHTQGRIPEDQIASLRATAYEHICTLDAGGALLMRPLLLHASSPSLVPDHRRVIHIDYAAVELPNGVRWFSENAPHRESSITIP